MSNPISDFTEFDRGAEAFDDGNDHLLYQCTDSFREGYREAYLQFAAKEYPRAANNPDSSHLEEYWSAHHDEAVTGMRERLLAKVLEAEPRKRIARANLKAQVRSFGLGILTAIGLGAFFLAPFLMDNEDVIAFWQGVIR